ncbi:MAG: fibronectin type III domain-containing protein [Vicinamibacterales bacterium]
MALSSIGSAGANGETMKVTAPQLVSPIGGVELTDLDPPFEFRHSTTKYANGQTFTYDFEIINPDGLRVVSMNLNQGPGSSTSVELTSDLDFGTNYTWRVRARLGALVGPWSASGAFKTFTRFSCSHFGPNPLAIIECHRKRFPAGPLEGNHEALYIMMRDVAWDFNRAGVPGGPWGILVKQSGNNCHGYSCDIICRGQGSAQEQFDVLLDENEPQWSGHNLPKEGSRVDVCEIQ